MKKVVVSGMLGNGLEWYDFALYSLAVPIISDRIFPGDDPVAGQLKTFAVFAIAFFFRPVGALFFGWLGDRYGRKVALVAAILMMAIPTGCIGLLPTYEQVGVLAPILLVAIRIFQGISIGGEFSGSIAYIVEHAPVKHRGMAGAASMGSLILGFMLGSATFFAFSKGMGDQVFKDWGWRIPFLLGIVIGMVGIYIRSRCDESPTYTAAKLEGKLSQQPIREAIVTHPLQILKGFGCYIGATMPFYLISSYLVTYTNKDLGQGPNLATQINFATMTAMLVGTLFSANLSDRIGRRKTMLPALLAMMAFVIPAFLMMAAKDDAGKHVLAYIVIAQVSLGMLNGLYIGPIAALLVELFPTAVRFSGMALAYNASAAMFGGTAPLIADWLKANEWIKSHNAAPLAIGGYVMACCLASLVALMFFQEKYGQEI